jgi:hypothetical protein
MSPTRAGRSLAGVRAGGEDNRKNPRVDGCGGGVEERCGAVLADEFDYRGAQRLVRRRAEVDLPGRCEDGRAEALAARGVIDRNGSAGTAEIRPEQ